MVHLFQISSTGGMVQNAEVQDGKTELHDGHSGGYYPRYVQ